MKDKFQRPKTLLQQILYFGKQDKKNNYLGLRSLVFFSVGRNYRNKVIYEKINNE